MGVAEEVGTAKAVAEKEVAGAAAETRVAQMGALLAAAWAVAVTVAVTVAARRRGKSRQQREDFALHRRRHPSKRR